MKKALITLLSAISLSAYAGEVISKEVLPPPPCFNAGEFQLDAFGSYLFDESNDLFGGGIGLNYFFTQNLGVGANWNIIDSDTDTSFGTQHFGDTTIHDTSLDLIYRLPLGPTSCDAIYFLGGIGVFMDGETTQSYNAGIGYEHRFGLGGPGVFAEYRHKWLSEYEADFSQARVGLRFVF